MKSILQFLFLFIFLNSFAQTNFEKGYFIDNSGQRIDCLIKNTDWKNNPTQFDYKISENDKINSGNIDDIKEFNIIGIAKYIRENVDIDISPENINSLSYSREPNFKRQTVYLKVLVEGLNNLYSYVGVDYPVRLFYSNQNIPLQQLIYKQFYKSIQNTSEISTNEDFKRQLYANVNCKENKQSTIERLRYNQSSIINYFIKTNGCLGDTTTKQISINKKTQINLKPLFSLNSSSMNLDIKTGTYKGQYDIKNKINFGVGFEVELVFPYNNNNWSLTLEPTYNFYKGETQFTTQRPFSPVVNHTTEVTYNYLQIPLGGRRYFYLNKNSKLFVNAAVNIVVTNKSSKIETDGTTFFNLGASRRNYSFGMGYQYQKINLEVRYYTNLELNTIDTYDSYTFKNLSLNLKYRLF